MWQYYTNLLDQLQEKIHEKRSDLAREKVIFHQDNTRLHTSVIAMAKIHELRYKLVLHLPYSPDLAPSEFHLFSKLKNFLGGGVFCRPGGITFSRWDKGIGILLDQMN
jgi:hypothetical protein